MMGKIICECGCDCRYDGELFRDNQEKKDNEYIYSFFESGWGLNVIECCKCGNLMIEDLKDSTMITYKPSNGKYNKLLHDKDGER